MRLDSADGEQLLDLAIGSIAASLASAGQVAPLPIVHTSACLSAPCATFVTLRLDGALRGCCGSIFADEPLVADVWRNAWRAAFADPRFRPLEQVEFTALEITISVLSPLEPIAAGSEAELLECLRPDIDGLLIECGEHRATFLPAVWKDLREPACFLAHLKRKAGLADGFWSADVRVSRYTAFALGPRFVATTVCHSPTATRSP